MTEPDDHKLKSLLASIDHKWRQIGEALKVANHKLCGIKDNENENSTRLSLVLQIWKETSERSEITWETVIIAVHGPIVNDARKAQEIRHYLANRS